jgi:hypothetical protein
MECAAAEAQRSLRVTITFARLQVNAPAQADAGDTGDWAENNESNAFSSRCCGVDPMHFVAVGGSIHSGQGFDFDARVPRSHIVKRDCRHNFARRRRIASKRGFVGDVSRHWSLVDLSKFFTK